MVVSVVAMIVCGAILMGILSLALLPKQMASPVVEQIPLVVQHQRQGWSSYIDMEHGFLFQYPVAYITSTLSTKDAYPELSYERPLANLVSAVRVSPQVTDLGYPKLEILVYAARGLSKALWLNANPDVAQGYANQETMQIGILSFTKFTGPAGDLVPSAMYIAEAGSYMIQINVQFGLSGMPEKVRADEIIQSFLSV